MRRIPSRATSLRAVALAAILILAGRFTSGLQVNDPNAPLATADQPMKLAEVADRDFIRTEYAADQFEIKISRRAIHQSPSKDIQDFARKTLQLQLPLDQNLYSAKLQLHIHSAKRLQRRYTRRLDRIGNLSGVAFDKAYLSTLLHAFCNDKNTYRYQLQTSTNPTSTPILQQGLSYYKDRLAALQKLATAHQLSDKKSRW